jgi:hypothetical protein
MLFQIHMCEFLFLMVISFVYTDIFSIFHHYKFFFFVVTYCNEIISFVQTKFHGSSIHVQIY